MYTLLKLSCEERTNIDNFYWYILNTDLDFFVSSATNQTDQVEPFGTQTAQPLQSASLLLRYLIDFPFTFLCRDEDTRVRHLMYDFVESKVRSRLVKMEVMT